MSAAPLLDTLHTLLRLPREQGTVEFKSNLDEPADIGRYLSALANTAALDRHDRAWVVWGVDDSTRQVQGTHFDPFTRKAQGNQSLVMWLQQMTHPRADFEFHELQHAQGRVVLLEIHPARSAPVAFQQQRWIRVDSRADLDALLLAKLLDVLSSEQKANKVKNLPQAMRRAGHVHTVGPRAHAVWKPGLGDQGLG